MTMHVIFRIVMRVAKVMVMMLMVAVGSVTAETVTLEIGERSGIDSGILNEKRSYSVYQPQACKSDDAQRFCAVLYLLDGSERNLQLAGAVVNRMMNAAQIPPTMIVAVPNTNRRRDMTPTHALDDGIGGTNAAFIDSGGGEQFLDFIEKELIPNIDKQYSPRPFRILVGHSLSGLLTLHSMITRPDLFQAYIAIDPSTWWADYNWLQQAETALRNHSTLNNRVYLASATLSSNRDIKRMMENSAERLAFALSSNGSPQLDFTFDQFPDEDYVSVVLPGLYRGLKSIFAGYKTVPNKIAIQGPTAVEEHYRNLLDNFGITLMPPLRNLLDLAGQATSEGNFPLALEYHQYSVEKYPRNGWARFSLAQTYKEMGKTDLAKRNYEQAIALDERMWGDYVRPILDEMEK